MRKKLTLVTSLAFAVALSAGFAVVSASAEGETTNWSEFRISATSVRLDDPNRDDDGSGLRFKIDVPESVAQGDITEAYTILTFKSSVVTEENTAGEPITYHLTVPAEVWRPESLNQGYGWNTVLTEIPVDDYVTDISAQAFLTVGGEQHETTIRTSSIAKTAARALANGTVATDDIEKVTPYVDKVVENVVLDQTSATLGEAETLQLAVSEPTGYDIVWASSNTKVAKVDSTGKVTEVSPGNATITAKLGTKTATCAVTVDYISILATEGHLDAAVKSNGSETVEYITSSGLTRLIFNEAFLKDVFETQGKEEFKFVITAADDAIELTAGSQRRVHIVKADGTVVNGGLAPIVYKDNTATVTIKQTEYETYKNTENAVALGLYWQSKDSVTGKGFSGDFTLSLVEEKPVILATEGHYNATVKSNGSETVEYTTSTALSRLIFNADFLKDVFETQGKEEFTFVITAVDATKVLMAGTQRRVDIVKEDGTVVNGTVAEVVYENNTVTVTIAKAHYDACKDTEKGMTLGFYWQSKDSVTSSGFKGDFTLSLVD